VQIATSVFHKLKFKNEWLYTTEGETLFVTCDEDKQSTSHIIKGVGKILLNKTCKAYATRDILISGPVHNQEYQDFVPGSFIPDLDEWFLLTVTEDIMENKQVFNSKVGDLLPVAKTPEQLESGNKIRQLEQGHQHSYYLLYVRGSQTVRRGVLSGEPRLCLDVDYVIWSKNKQRYFMMTNTVIFITIILIPRISYYYYTNQLLYLI
jgi:hypothetical protein